MCAESCIHDVHLHCHLFSFSPNWFWVEDLLALTILVELVKMSSEHWRAI
jgi:hypothetical protein